MDTLTVTLGGALDGHTIEVAAKSRTMGLRIAMIRGDVPAMLTPVARAIVDSDLPDLAAVADEPPERATMRRETALMGMLDEELVAVLEGVAASYDLPKSDAP